MIENFTPYLLVGFIAYVILTEKNSLEFLNLALRWVDEVFFPELRMKLRLAPRLYFETLVLRYKMRKALSKKEKQQQRDHGN